MAINKSNNDVNILLKYFILLSEAGIVYLLSFKVFNLGLKLKAQYVYEILDLEFKVH